MMVDKVNAGVSGTSLAAVAALAYQILIPINGQIADLSDEIDQLEREVEIGHQISEKNANAFAVDLEVADIVGRTLMYRAKRDAGIITEGETARWNGLIADQESKMRASQRLKEEAQALKMSLITN